MMDKNRKCCDCGGIIPDDIEIRYGTVRARSITGDLTTPIPYVSHVSAKLLRQRLNG